MPLVVLKPIEIFYILSYDFAQYFNSIYTVPALGSAGPNCYMFDYHFNCMLYLCILFYHIVSHNPERVAHYNCILARFCPVLYYYSSEVRLK